MTARAVSASILPLLKKLPDGRRKTSRLEETILARESEWTEAEFAIVIENPALSDAVLAHKLRTRSAAEVTAMRDLIHEYHGTKHVEGVPMRVVIPRLKRGGWVCVRCGEKQ